MVVTGTWLHTEYSTTTRFLWLPITQLDAIEVVLDLLTIHPEL